MENRLYDGHSYEFAYVWAVLAKEKAILMSWGVDPYSIREIANGTSFHVQGFIHRGFVEVTVDYGTDTFTVVLKTDAGETVGFHTGIHPGELIRVTDLLVEKTDDYEERVRHEYLAT